MKISHFRRWCNDKWYEHMDELELYHQPRNYDSKEYFRRYKYWLKREYQHQRKET